MSPSKMRRPTEVNGGRSLERDAYNFDFRVVLLALILVARPELLDEYLRDGEEKDEHHLPLAVANPRKWPHLRKLFDPAMLADVLYLWEFKKTQECATYLLQVCQTMINLNEYDFDGCPNPEFVKAIVNYAGQQTAELHPAGVADDEPEEESSDAENH